MDVMNDAIVSFYRSKFDLSAETLKQMMDSETWFSGREAAEFKFDCEVLADETGFSIAAKLKDMDLSKFMKTPKALKEMIMEKEEEKTAEQMIAEAVSEEPKAEEAKAEEPKAEETPAEEIPAEEPKGEMVPKAECDKRVSGMQSAMAKQMDAMKKDYEAKIADFQVQIKAKDQELTKAKAEVTSLAEKLEEASRELSDTTSALMEKKNALDALNAGVNTPNATEGKPWKKLRGEALLKWCRENPGYKA